MTSERTKGLLEFVTLPQCILAIFLTLAFTQAGEYPTIAMTTVFIFQFAFNIAIVAYYMKNKLHNVRSNNGKQHDNTAADDFSIKTLYALLIIFLIIFCFGVFIIFEQFSSTSVISPETLYILCCSVTLIYLAAKIIRKTVPKENPNISAMIIVCAALPVTVYLLLASSYTLGDVSIVLSIGLLCVFVFMLGKLGFIFYKRGNKSNKNTKSENIVTSYSKKYKIFVAIVAILLPQVGLLVNNNLFSGEGVLGDFSSLWFNIIAALNGLVLLVDINKTKYKLPIFYMKTAGLIFIAYFTLIFAPYMLYAIIGVLYLGLGLLVYVPVVIFVLQLKQLMRDSKILKCDYKRPIIAVVAAVGLITLPAILAVNFSIDRINFNNAMSYVNEDQHNDQNVNFGRLNRSFAQIESTMLSTRRQVGLTFLPGTPLITTVYRYIALDNMYFTENTLLRLQKIFMPEKVVSASEIMLSEQEPNSNFKTKITVNETEFDTASGAYKAWVDFEITSLSDTGFSEYETKFEIPDGCFITDYYLYVGSLKKRGIITDKRAAQVAYESIIRTPMDPGIIYYDNDNTVSLRVYPFIGSETRKTGFQIMYSQSEELNIEGQAVHLTAENTIEEPIIIDGAHFLSADYKKTLPIIEREPIYYFLLDAESTELYNKHVEAAKRYAESKNINSKYYAVSYQANEVSDLEKSTVQAKGGFNTAYAMNKIYTDVPDGYFPIIVLVTDNMNRSVPLEKTRLASSYPEVDCYYRLNDNFSLTPYKFADSRRLRDVDEPNIADVLDYNGITVSAEGNETIITDLNLAEFTGNQYLDAFVIQKNTFLANTNNLQISSIKESMLRRILTRNTAFIVMETKEQEDMLLSLQEQFLNGKNAGTPSVMMSEPTWIAVVAAIGIIFLLRRRLSFNGNK